MSQMSQVPQVSECRHLEMGKECGDFPDDQVTIFWRKIMALMDNVMAIRLGSRHDVFRVSNMNAHIMHTCIYIHSHTHIYTHFLESDMGKNIWTSIDVHFSMSKGILWVFPKGRVREQCGWHEGNLAGLSVWREGCEMMADFLLKDMDILYIYTHIFSYKYNTHTVYIIYPYIYIYTHFFYTYATLRGTSQVQEVPMRRLYRRSKPYSDEVGNLRLLVN